MDKKYNFGIIKNDYIILFNKSTVTGTVTTDDFIEDVSINLTDNEILTISGQRIEYDYYPDYNRIFEDEWKNTPDNKLIKEGKRHFWSSKKERYVNRGWVRTTKRTPVTYILNNYKLKILE